MRLKGIFQKYRHILILYLIFILVLVFTFFSLAFFLPIEGFSTTFENINKEVSSTFINGILTVTAIIFGFLSIEIRNYFKNLKSILLIIFPIFFALMFMVTMYFNDTIISGYPTVTTAFWIFVFFVSISIYGFCILLTFSYFKREELPL
jgi:hypothetical protein